MNTMKAALIVAGVAPKSYAVPTKARVEKLNTRAKTKFAEWTKLNESVVEMKDMLKIAHEALKEARADYEVSYRVFCDCISEMVNIGDAVYFRAQKYIKPSELVAFNAAASEDRYSWLSQVMKEEINETELDAYNACAETVGGLDYELLVGKTLIANTEKEIAWLGEEIARQQIAANIINFKFGFARMNEWQIEQTGMTAIGQVVSALLS